MDIGCNLLDHVFKGVYRGSSKHPPDIAQVLLRANKHSVSSIIVTAGTLDESKQAIEFIQEQKDSPVRLYSTVGIHPTRCNAFEDYGADALQRELLNVARSGVEKRCVVAVGECGLDYDRLQFCSKETQLRHFERHLALTEATSLPMFLHSRTEEAGHDLSRILRANRSRFPTGVVHSFTSSKEILDEFLDLDLYIGINGCSLKTEENLQVIKHIPADRIMLETDAPYCDIKPTHASFKFVESKFDQVIRRMDTYDPEKHHDFVLKGRNEPCSMIQVLEVVAALKEIDKIELAEIVLNTTNKVFKLSK